MNDHCIDCGETLMPSALAIGDGYCHICGHRRAEQLNKLLEAARVMYHATGDSREWHRAHDALMYAVEEIQEIDAQSKSPSQHKE